VTHTLHRIGSEEELFREYVILAIPARGYNRDGAGAKLKEIFEIYRRHNPINIGVGQGNIFNSDIENMEARIEDRGAVHAVFNNEDDLVACLRELKERDVGLSVVVSGLFNHVRECCEQAGLKPHTVNTSVGIFGKTELLPERGVMEIHTMCGHAMNSFSLIKHMVGKIKAGRITAKKAAEKMAANCHCGIFNPERAELLLQKLADK
jgi:hypothetical protein